MRTFSLGFERKEGMKILVYDEQTEQTEPELIKIEATDFEGKSQASRKGLKDKFLEKLSPQDEVISPARKNRLLLGAAFQRTGNVHWLPDQYLNDEYGVSESRELYKQWQKNPENFYEFQELDQTTRKIRTLYREWMQTEKERIAVSNSLTQLLRHVRDRVLLLDISEEEFVQNYVAENKGFAQRLARSLGHRPNSPKVKKMLEEQGFSDSEIEAISSDWGKLRSVLSEQLVKELGEEAHSLYQAYFQSRKQNVTRAEKNVKQRKLEFLTRREEELKKRVNRELERSVLAEAKQELTGMGVRLLGAAVTYIRSPLLYENVNSLLAYFNFFPYKGRRRTRKEAAKMGGALFKAETKFRFEWPDQPAFFSNEKLTKIYRSYKLWRWLVYYPLCEITQEVFDLRTGDTLDTSSEDIKDIARRIFHLRELPIIKRNKEAKNKLKRIWGTGSPKELKGALERLVTETQREHLLTRTGLDMKDLQLESDKEEKGSEKVKNWAQEMLKHTDNLSLANALINIAGSGDGKELWEVMSNRTGCHDIQMTRNRLESIARGEVGKQALKCLYYDWLDKELRARIDSKSKIKEQLKQRFKADKNYRNQYECYSHSGQVPVTFELEAVGTYYAHQARKVAKEKGYQSLEVIPDVIIDSCKAEHVNRILNL